MSSCCAARPPEYRRVPADRIPELIPLLTEVTAPGDGFRSYRCRECGQVWQQHMVDGEALVVQLGWARRVQPAGPAAVPVRAAAASPAPAPPGWRRRRGSLAVFVLLAVVFFMISTLPPFVTGPLAGGAWLARWIVGVLLVVLAFQTILDIARRPGKRA